MRKILKKKTMKTVICRHIDIKGIGQVNYEVSYKARNKRKNTYIN